MSRTGLIGFCIQPIRNWLRRLRARMGRQDLRTQTCGNLAITGRVPDSPVSNARWAAEPWGPNAATAAEIDAAQSAFQVRELRRAQNLALTLVRNPALQSVDRIAVTMHRR